MRKSYLKNSITLIFSFSLSIVVIGSSFAGQKISIPLSGTAIVNEVTSMSVNPPLVDLGAIEIGSEFNQTVAISNLGNADENSIQINSITIGGANSNEFMIQLPSSMLLAPGESVDLDVSFFPVTAGEKTASLYIDHDGANSEHIIFLRGMGLEQPVSELVASPASLSLGTIEFGNVSNKNLVLTNHGESTAPNLNIQSVEITGENAEDFSTDFASQITLPPSGSKILKVTMSSGTYGNKNATLNIKNDGISPVLKIELSGKVNQPDNGGQDDETPEFTQSKLSGLAVHRPTTIKFGPDGKLYVGQMDGTIKVLTINRKGANDYTVTNTETIDLIKNIVNHDDDGSVNTTIKGRLLTGLTVTGTANNPEIFLASGDPRQGGGPGSEDTNLDTNSGILSRLFKQGGSWVKEDLVRGLPRSEENHQPNGIIFDQTGTKLLVVSGGNTNMGAPSGNFLLLPEFALSGAILEIDLNAIGNPPYDLPTLDDEDRAGVADYNDPFGGNNGKNQAILEASGPVKIYAPGFRNAYDLVLTESNRLYTIDNGPNNGWGGIPIPDCSNTVVNQGTTLWDALHYVSHRGYYGGHPNPTRGDKSNKFNNSNPQSPISVAANTIECNFFAPDKPPQSLYPLDNSLTSFKSSTNGIDEYTASNFGGAMKGDLLAASFDKSIWRIELNEGGDTLMSKSQLFPSAGVVPLDVTTQDDESVFPGTIWVADYSSNVINVFEPSDYLSVGAATSTILNDDSDSNIVLQNELDANGLFGDAEALLMVVPSHLIQTSSTHESGSFSLTNNSASGQTIESIIIDTSSATLPDIVFDPYSTAGDFSGKDLTVDSDESSVGLVAHSFGKANGGGYHQLKIDFNDFEPDESFSFSIDSDPTSIKGLQKPDTLDAANVSGLELSGTRVTVFFSDKTIKSNDLFLTSYTETFSNTSIKSSTSPRPGISVVGLDAPAAVTDSLQTIRVTGQPGSEIRMIIVEAGLYVDSELDGGFDIDLYEANSAIGVSEYNAVIGASGEVDIPVTLKKSDSDGGINKISATVIDESGNTGLVSETLTLQLY